MKPGDLRHRVTIQRRTVTRDGFAGETEAYADIATVWAKVDAVGGREYYGLGQTLAESTFTVLMRYRTDVTPDVRLKWGLRYFNVLVVIPDAKMSQLTVGCKEVSV